MTITQGLVDEARKYLNEEIPEMGTVSETLFTDIMIIEVLSTSDTINQALYLLWTKKAGLVQKGSEVKQINAGGESVQKYTKMDYVKMCLETAKGYKELWDEEKDSGNSFSIALMKRRPRIW